MKKAWENVIETPAGPRASKPRTSGLTMVIDKGLGLHHLKDLIQVAGEYIDIIKLTFGTSAFYDEDLLKEKNSLITSAGMEVMPGGTFLEVAVWQQALDAYLKRAQQLGFSAIEVSDGTIDIPLKMRKRIIEKCQNKGFKVITEVGKKDPEEILPISLVHELIREDLKSGAFKVIIEAREAGRSVGIFDQEGKIKEEEVDHIVAGVDNVNNLIWEAPLKHQQQALIIRFGPDVNLGNIPPEEVLALEALREGLRGDTLKRAYLKSKDWKPPSENSKE
ncbi:MAG: phosphosulfolactate synthase [Candidatus Aminicenantales bacterium]